MRAEKLDFKRRDKALYRGSKTQWNVVNVPPITCVAIDGMGDPGGPVYARALAALYPVVYTLKFAQKAAGTDFVVPPLEALWWADDPKAFVAGRRDVWRWTCLLRVPDDVDDAAFQAARSTAATKQRKKGVDVAAMDELQLQTRREGVCLQRMHIGPYTEEAPVLAELHDHIMPAAGWTFSGPHHEIYFNDPRRTAPEKLRTLLRQPVEASAGNITG